MVPVTLSHFSKWFDAHVPKLQQIALNLVNSESAIYITDGETARVISPYRNTCLLANFTERNDGVYRCDEAKILDMKTAENRVDKEVYKEFKSAMPNSRHMVNMIVAVKLAGFVKFQPLTVGTMGWSITEAECQEKNDAMWKALEFHHKSIETCHVCNAKARQRCSRCKVTAYCGRGHQTVDWDHHKADCHSLAVDKALALLKTGMERALDSYPAEWDTCLITIPSTDFAVPREEWQELGRDLHRRGGDKLLHDVADKFQSYLFSLHGDAHYEKIRLASTEIKRWNSITSP